MKFVLFGWEATYEMFIGFVGMLALGAFCWVGFRCLMKFVRSREPFVDEPKGEELLRGRQAVDGATVSCPVDGIKDCICPDVFVFLFEKVFSELE